MKHYAQAYLTPFLALTTLILASIACSLTNLDLPEVQNHPQPDLVVQPLEIQDSWCPKSNGSQRCRPESPPAQLGCLAVRTPGDFLGGLDPAYPITLCLSRADSPGERLPEGTYIYQEGCMVPSYVRYLIEKDGEYQVVQSLADLQQVYAPILSENEALSYALAATGLGVRFSLDAPREFRYFVDQLEDTHVEETPQGYLVHLFDYKACGCGPHPTSAVTILVKPDGHVEEVARVKLFEDPEEDGLCID